MTPGAPHGHTVHILEGKRLVASLPLPPSRAASSAPLISCLTVSGGSPHLLPAAIVCFQRQHYPNLEMVVVGEGETAPAAEMVRDAEDDRIRYVAALPGISLGVLRNISVQAARGEWIAQWDEDDLSHPGRIERQWLAAEAGGADACMLLQESIWLPVRGMLGRSHKQRLCEHSLLVRRDRMPAYPDLARGEDTSAVGKLTREVRVAALSAPELYLYIHHGRNVFGQDHFERQMIPGSIRTGTAYARVYHEMKEHLPLHLTLSALDMREPELQGH